VVARRRLRAAKDQIILVTRAAKSKRVELESVVLAHNMAQQSTAPRSSNGGASGSPVTRISSMLRQTTNTGRCATYEEHAFVVNHPLHAETPSSAVRVLTRFNLLHRTRQEGYHRTRPLRQQESHRQTIAGLTRSDSEDSVDIAALLYELELASAAAVSSANDPQANSGAAGAAAESNQAMEAILQRERRLEMLQMRMQLLFGQQEQAENNGTTLPPPVPSHDNEETHRTSASAESRGSAANTSVYSTPSRATNIRQARGSPGDARYTRFNYTVDPDFVDESDEDSSADDAAAAGRQASHDDDNVMNLVDAGTLEEATDALRNLLRFGTPEQINRTAEAMPTASTLAGTPATGATLQTQGSSSRGHNSQGRESRHDRRQARLSHRVEEEAALNRAILLSLQENQSPEQRRTAAPAGTDGAAAPSAAPAESDIAMLESMGFTREQSVQALVENRLNVELAANRLLGIDF
jgi:hypothetical protein